MGVMASRIQRAVPIRHLLYLVPGICACALFALAQSTPAAVPVLLDGKAVITIRWGYGNSTPVNRAQAIAGRLKAVAEDPGVPLEITPQPTSMGIDIRCGKVILASVFAGDADAENTTQIALAQRWSNRFLTAMQEHREKYSWREAIWQSIVAVLVIAACILLLWFLRRRRSAIERATSALLERRVEGGRVHVVSRLSSSWLSILVTRTLDLIRLLLLLIVAGLAIHTLLGIFPATRPFAMEIYGGIVRATRTFLDSFWRNLPSLVFVLILAVVTWYLIRLIRYFFGKISEGAISIEGFRPAWSTVTARLISIAVVVLAALIVYPYFPGSQSLAFKGISIFLGVLVSLGSTGLVSNVLAGIMLTYMNAFEVGDLVKIGDITAYVKSTSLLTTRLVTRNNEIITVPNAFILDKHVINYTSHTGGEDSVLISTGVGMGYDVPWRQVEAMLLEAAARTECVTRDPQPFVVILQLDTFGVNYEVNAYLKAGVRLYMGLTELNHNVLDVFNEYGVSIMTPAYRGDPAQPKVVARDDWFAAPASTEQTPRPTTVRKYPPSQV